MNASSNIFSSVFEPEKANLMLNELLLEERAGELVTVVVDEAHLLDEKVCVVT